MTQLTLDDLATRTDDRDDAPEDPTDAAKAAWWAVCDCRACLVARATPVANREGWV